jgi:hypothetical protein
MDDERNKRTFVFDLADVPVVAHALAVEYGTYIGYDRGKCRRVKELYDLVAEQVPTCARLFDPEDWQEFCRLIADGAAYEVGHERKSWNLSTVEGEAVLKIGDKEWRSRAADLLPGAPALDDLRAFLGEYAPEKPIQAPST